MLVLNKGVNQIYVTVSELNTINNAIYTLNIKDETSHDTKSITVVDTSLYAIRYNQFQVTVVDNQAAEDLPNGIAYLKAGKHTYTITATNPISPFNSVICEWGIVKVKKFTPSPIESYTDSLPIQEYKSYTGDISQNI